MWCYCDVEQFPNYLTVGDLAVCLSIVGQESEAMLHQGCHSVAVMHVEGLEELVDVASLA